MKGNRQSRASKVSVVMATYNAKGYLREAIESVLNQTFKDFEFVIIDDGSTDETIDVIKSYKDPRIRLHKKNHRGLIASLNEGMKLARGEYIARMDADDISEPGRFERQVRFLDDHPEYAVVGTTIEVIDLEGHSRGVEPEPLDYLDLVKGLIVRNVLAHGSVMMRKAIIRELGGYDSSAKYVEDYDLWMRVARRYRMANLPQVLYKWRLNPKGVSLTKTDEQRRNAQLIQKREWNYYKEHSLLPTATFREVFRKRRKRHPKDLFWGKRRGTLSEIYARFGTNYLSDRDYSIALREISQAIILSPFRFIRPILVFVTPKPIRRVLRELLSKKRGRRE